MWVFFFYCILKEIKLTHRRHPRVGGDRDHKNKKDHLPPAAYSSTGGEPAYVLNK